MSAPTDIAGLIPHQAAMCLLERVVEWDDRHAVLATTTHRSTGNPLRSAGRLRAIHLCEYGAQAAAVHGGLISRQRGETARPALLVALRDVHLFTDFVDQLPGELNVEAVRLLAGATGWQYSFEVRHGTDSLISGRASIMVRTA